MAAAPASIRRARPLLGTFVEIAAAGEASDALEAAVEAAFAAVATAHRLMSFHEAGSDVSRLNRDAAARPVEVHEWTYEVLAAACDLHRRSAGAFDISVAPALQRIGLLPQAPAVGCVPSPHDGPAPSPPSSGGEGWGEGGGPQGQSFGPREGVAAASADRAWAALESNFLLGETSRLLRQAFPGSADLAARPPHPNPLPPKRGERGQAVSGTDAAPDLIQLLPDNQIRFAHPAAQIDLGGIAKGFAVDRAIEALQQRGITDGLVNAGGDLRVFGSRPRIVDIRDPRRPDRAIFRVALCNAALASSAGRFDPVRSRHALPSAVIDPATAMPAQSISGATVCAPTCVIADALTKVVMNAGENAGAVLEYYGADALFVSSHGDAHMTANWKNEVHLAA
jgi:thiamine biosynthesis lipoprotein ApbE